ncbi:MAG: protein kinase [Cyanobacteria bacterium J06635_15]
MALNFLRHFRSESAKSLGGRYQIVQQLGAGGFGQTFVAQDLHLPGHPSCVVKQLQPQVNSAKDLEVARRLFDTEAQTLYQLGSHPQIPRLLAHFEDNQEFYLAQELIEGHALDAELTTATPWTDSQVVAFLDDILGTLAFVHEQSVIHRDLKPSNLIRRRHDNRIVLIDFGAVKQVSTQTSVSSSNVSQTISIGTRGYMPNEQIAGRPQFSSDVYAAGMIAVQALTGQHPIMIQPHPQTGELDWHTLAPHSHPSLIALLDYMVRYDFRSRYSTAGEALAALRSAFPDRSQSTPPVANTNPALSYGQSESTAYPQPNNALPPHAGAGNTPQPSPSMAVRTVAVGRRPAKAAVTERTPSPYAAPRSSHPQPPRKLALPIGIGIGTLLVLGLFTWRACTPTPTVETATPNPESSSLDSSPEPDIDAIIPDTPTEPNAPPSEETQNPEPTPAPVVPPTAETTPESEPTDPPTDDAAAVDPPESAVALTPAEAQTTVGNFYSHVSNQTWDAARSLTGGTLAQQFDPNFFGQFQQVTVENLRVTNQTDESVELIGQNTYVYPDGSTQREERTYTVQITGGQPRIVGSSFVRITQSRGN